MYSGRLLTLGLLGASVVRTAPPIPEPVVVPPARFDIVQLRVVRGDSPPFPGASVTRWGGGPATVLTFNQNVGLRVTAGDSPDLPDSIVRRDVLGHTGATPAAPAPNPFLRGRVVAGDPPPLPDAQVERFGGPATVVTFNQNVDLRVVQGDAPPLPEGSVDRRGGPSTVVTFNQHVGLRQVLGDPPGLPEAGVFRRGGPSTVLTFNQTIGLRIVQGEGPKLPESSIRRDDLAHTGAEPPTPGDNIFIGRRFVQGDSPPYPEASTQRIPTQRAQVADHRLKELHRLVSGEAPTPEARVDRWGLTHPDAAPVLPGSIFMGSRHLQTDYFEEGRVLRWGQFHTGLPVIQTTGGFLGRSFMS